MQKSVQFSGDLHYLFALFLGYKKVVLRNVLARLIIRCESHGPGSFVIVPGRKDPGFVLQYL